MQILPIFLIAFFFLIGGLILFNTTGNTKELINTTTDVDSVAIYSKNNDWTDKTDK